jgi:lysophospholipase L1-like esterase
MAATMPAAAQTPPTTEPVGIVDMPCPPPLEMPAQLRQALQSPNPAAALGTGGPAAPPPPEIAAYLQAREKRARDDFGGLCQYQGDNAKLVMAHASPPVAVFIGDSITEGWVRLDADFFATNGYIGRGISGQTTAQNLLRFQQDVIALHPKVVHIMIGTNDVAGNTGPTSYQSIQNNIVAMVTLAHANRIRVVLATIPPAADFPWRHGMSPAPKIIAMNDWIRAYAQREKLTLADYHASLATPDGGFRPEWSHDGVHPNAAGYQQMDPIARAAIQAASKQWH